MTYSDILLTVDFDRTLTGRDSTIPQRNLDAIRYFMEKGGSFTVNTGRSVATFWKYLDTIPVNAPFLLYNGSAAYDRGQLTRLHTIRLDVWDTMKIMLERFSDFNVEIQGPQVHYLLNADEAMVQLYKNFQWRYTRAQFGQDIGPFLKFSLFGAVHNPVVGDMFSGTEEELRRFDQAEEEIRELFGDKVEVYRAAPRIIDVHAKGVSKLTAARELQRDLGKKLLICVGDAENDIMMLDGADYAFCPAESVVAGRYPAVCNCDEGAVADVIYEKIPEILGLPLDRAKELC